MRLMLSFNRNMLALFLAANLLTGAVNLSINTLAVGRWGARSIVGEWQGTVTALVLMMCIASLTAYLANNMHIRCRQRSCWMGVASYAQPLTPSSLGGKEHTCLSHATWQLLCITLFPRMQCQALAALV
jgi:hypothetical protein